MKTPREILVARHRAAGSKLDALRESVVAAVCDRRTSAVEGDQRRSQTAATSIWQTLWQELILPSRRVWAGLATVWLLLAAFNLAQRDSAVARTTSTAPVAMSFREQQRLLNELFANSTPIAAEADRPKFFPRPRTKSSESFNA
jgi:hypothetical protein